MFYVILIFKMHIILVPYEWAVSMKSASDIYCIKTRGFDASNLLLHSVSKESNFFESAFLLEKIVSQYADLS